MIFGFLFSILPFFAFTRSVQQQQQPQQDQSIAYTVPLTTFPFGDLEISGYDVNCTAALKKLKNASSFLEDKCLSKKKFNKTINDDWEALCSSSCSKGKKSLFQNVAKKCGERLVLKSKNRKPTTPRAIFTGEEITHNILCSKIERKFCWLNLEKTNFDKKVNNRVVCDSCGQLLYSAIKPIQSLMGHFKGYFDTTLEPADKFMNYASNFCHFRNSTGVPYVNSAAKTGSSILILLIAFFLNFLL